MQPEAQCRVKIPSKEIVYCCGVSYPFPPRPRQVPKFE